MEPDIGTGNFAAGIVQIAVLNLVLSGDNAVVIGVVASRLRGRQRRLAILSGSGGAVVLRIALSSVALLLLRVPVLSDLGGALLLWIGWRLLRPNPAAHSGDQGTIGLRQAIQIVIVADVVMSLDNVLAVAGAANNNLLLLVIGLALSIPILFVGAGIIASISDRFPIILYVGSALIFRIATTLILSDPAVAPLWQPNIFLGQIAPWIAFIAGPILYIAVARARGRPIVPLFVNPLARPTPDVGAPDAKPGGGA